MRVQFDQTNPGSPAAGTFLIRLKEAHRQLLEEIGNLGDLAIGPPRESAALANARWRISQASLRRGSLATSIFDFLSAQLDGHEFRSLRTLRLEDEMLLQRSARHISTWTSASILHDWAGYCEASRDIRGHMKAYIQTESNLIYPLLERLASRGV